MCSLVIGGGHQVAGLLNVLVLLLAAALCAVRRRNFWQVPALAAAMAGLLLNVLAPGTQVRTAGFAGAGFAGFATWLDQTPALKCWMAEKIIQLGSAREFFRLFLKQPSDSDGEGFPASVKLGYYLLIATVV